VKTVIEYPYSYFKIFHMWGSAGTIWKWDMDQDQLADATFYKGSMRIQRAYDRTIEGTVLRGFVEFRRASPQLSQYLQYQLCVNDVDSEWYCVHGKDCTLDVSFVQLLGEIMLPTHTSLVILEGSAEVRPDTGKVSLGPMDHYKPRSSPICVNGFAKALLIRSSGKLPSLISPPGINTPNDALDALRQVLAEIEIAR